jgi:thymidylate synthase ThyX
MFGDGTVTKHGARVYNTKSKGLADDVQELIIKSGRVGTISYCTTEDKYYVRESLHDVNVANKHKRQDSLYDVTGERVYCVTVPNRILVTRRDTKVVLSANCYDSLGSGRGSAAYHKHIMDVRHLSVLEHAVFTVELQADRPPEAVYSVLINRPGLYVLPVGQSMGTSRFRITLNLRSVVEWRMWSMQGTPFVAIGDELQRVAHGLAPLIVPPPADSHIGVTITPVLPIASRERAITLFLQTSRGVSHETVRHRMNAISQRSTRFVDEDETPWILHPLLAAYLDATRDRGLFSCLWTAQALARDAYSRAVERLEAYGKQQGMDAVTARKQARGAARGYLGNALMTNMLVTADVYQWWNILMQRHNPAADGEMQVTAKLMLDALRQSRYARMFTDSVLEAEFARRRAMDPVNYPSLAGSGSLGSLSL